MPYTIDLTTDIAASPNRVWRALIDPAAVARWDATVIAALDAPPDYPQPGQHVRWRCRNTTELLHDQPQHVEPERRLHSHLTLGRQRLDETYILEAITDKQQAPGTAPANTARPEPLEGRETPDTARSAGSLSLEGEGRGDGASDRSAGTPETPSLPIDPADPWPNPHTLETPSAPRPAGRGARGSGGEVSYTTLRLHIDLTVRAPFIAGPLLLHLIDGPGTRRAAEACLTNLKYYCELAPA